MPIKGDLAAEKFNSPENADLRQADSLVASDQKNRLNAEPSLYPERSLRSEPLVSLTPSEKITQRLIEQGEQALSVRRLLTPENDNANLYFQVALGRDPGNYEAIQGIAAIVDLYTQWAWQAALNNNFQQAGRYLDLARLVNPEDPVLREMSSRIGSLQQERSRPNNREMSATALSSQGAATRNLDDSSRTTWRFTLPKDLFSKSEEDILSLLQPIIDQVSASKSSIVISWPNDKESRLMYQIINSRVPEFRVRAMTYHRADYRVELQQD